MKTAIRQLAPTEYRLVAPILAQNGMGLPEANLSQIFAAFDQVGSVLGLSVVQLLPHLDPVWVTISERGSKLWEDLVREQLHSPALEAARGSLFSLVERPGAAKLLADKFGFEDQPYRVMEYKLKGG